MSPAARRPRRGADRDHDAAPHPAPATADQPVYIFGLRVSGLPALPGSPHPPMAGSRRAVALRIVDEAEADARWQPRQARRLVDRRFPDGSLFLAVDADASLGYRIEAPEIGVHLVSADGTEVLLPEPQGPDWFWQRLLFAQTLPIAATLQGLGLFHASAVRIGDRVVAVSAASGTGKSSTAAHMIAQGAEFFTDDVLALEVIQGDVFAFAGPLFSNIEEHEILAVEPAQRERLGRLLGESTKQHMQPTASQTSLPLGVLYLLERAAEVDDVRVEPLDGSGVLLLLGSAFVAHLDTEERLKGHLELCAEMSTAGLIYRVQAPLHGSAAAVATVLMDHASAAVGATATPQP
jgi:hypothetical protein